MNKWIAEFDLEDGDTMPEHMDLEYKGAKLDFHCRPKEPILDKIRVEIEQAADKQFQIAMGVADLNERYVHIQMENAYRHILNIIDKYMARAEGGDKK